MSNGADHSRHLFLPRPEGRTCAANLASRTPNSQAASWLPGQSSCSSGRAPVARLPAFTCHRDRHGEQKGLLWPSPGPVSVQHGMSCVLDPTQTQHAGAVCCPIDIKSGPSVAGRNKTSRDNPSLPATRKASLPRGPITTISQRPAPGPPQVPAAKPNQAPAGDCAACLWLDHRRHSHSHCQPRPAWPSPLARESRGQAREQDGLDSALPAASRLGRGRGPYRSSNIRPWSKVEVGVELVLSQA